MGFYNENILPRLINLACAAKPTMKQREKVVPQAAGPETGRIAIEPARLKMFYTRMSRRKA